jgi:hypothetical protein
MKDMLSVILRIILGIVAIFMIIMVFAIGTNSSEDKRKIRLEQERLAEYTVKNYEDVRKIEFKSFEKNNLTGVWHADAIINDKYYIVYSVNGIGENGYIGILHRTNKSYGEMIRVKKNKDEKVDLKSIEIEYVKG